MTGICFAAGLVGLQAREFLIAATLGGAVRAGAFAVLGTALLSWGPAASIAIGLGLALLIFAPLSIPSVRAWALGSASAVRAGD